MLLDSPGVSSPSDIGPSFTSELKYKHVFPVPCGVDFPTLRQIETHQ